MANSEAKNQRLVARVGSYQEAMRALSDAQLQDKTQEFRERTAHGEALDHLLPEAYAAVREAALRVLRARLLAARAEQAAAQASAARRSQVRTVDRSERIRTYNFPENRIADHRTGYKAYNLDQVLDGELGPVIASAIAADDAARMAAVGQTEAS